MGALWPVGWVSLLLSLLGRVAGTYLSSFVMVEVLLLQIGGSF